MSGGTQLGEVVQKRIPLLAHEKRAWPVLPSQHNHTTITLTKSLWSTPCTPTQARYPRPLLVVVLAWAGGAQPRLGAPSIIHSTRPFEFPPSRTRSGSDVLPPHFLSYVSHPPTHGHTPIQDLAPLPAFSCGETWAPALQSSGSTKRTGEGSPQASLSWVPRRVVSNTFPLPWCNHACV